MSTTARQNNLILNEDWKRVYQTFKNADFKSYDFENIRRVMISYLRENYPEDFNDYIESSEYLALIDTIAFLGQSLSFRIDLASRENFLELAERKESVLRLAKMLSYNAKRNVPGQGLLKFNSINTTEQIVDGNGKNLANQTIRWNDPTNTNWAEQFITVMNSAMADNQEFGKPADSNTIDGVPSEQYRLRTTSFDVPLFNFGKSVAGRTMSFEIVSTSFKEQETYYEEPPVPGNQMGFIYRQDGKGPGSENTGFYMMFKQGSLELADFTFDVPVANDKLSVDSDNINNNDVWLYQLDSNGAQIAEWSQVSNLVGNNISYNSLFRGIRNIYAVETKENDKIDLVFSDGVYGNLPLGPFRVYYRVSNGLQYAISPREMRGINVSVKYLSKNGTEQTLTIGLGLEYTVTTAARTESIASIKQNAPATYYTQNRMITGEDYNLAPLSSSQNILKVKTVNRTSSGVSRNFDLVDATGKYSSVNVFGDDGYVYKQDSEQTLSFKFNNRVEIVNFIKNQLEPKFTSKDIYNFYLTKYDKILFPEDTSVWVQVSDEVNSSTGYFKSTVDQSLLKVGTYTTNVLKYATPGTAIKFTAPAGFKFLTTEYNKLVDDTTDSDYLSDFVWATVKNVSGDGTNAGRGVLTTGLGPIVLSSPIPSDAIASRIVPKFINNLPDDLESEIINQVVGLQTFGLRYDIAEAKWKLIQQQNLNLIDEFSLGKSGDTTNENIDASWIVAFERKPDSYTVKIRTVDYIFGSVQQNRFYLDPNDTGFNNLTRRTEKDNVKVLSINKNKDNLGAIDKDYVFDIYDTIKYSDGYEDTKEVKVTFADLDNNNVADNPDSFINIVGEDTDLKYLFFEETTDTYGTTIYNLIDNSSSLIILRAKESQVNVNDFDDGQLIYFYDSNEKTIKQVNKTTNTLDLKTSYKAVVGRDNIKFQYKHSASEDRRIDPSSTNIMDLYLLTRSYDTVYRNYLAGTTIKPEAPTEESLRSQFGTQLSNIKAISDEIIFHPVNYKELFGSTAEPSLRASFKVVKNNNKSLNDNDLKVRIVNAINSFFAVENWDFGDRFYLGELTTYVLNVTAPDVSNLVITPVEPEKTFGTLFEIQSAEDEIFVSSATVDDIQIVTSITEADIKTNFGSTSGGSY